MRPFILDFNLCSIANKAPAGSRARLFAPVERPARVVGQEVGRDVVALGEADAIEASGVGDGV
jgi:hypothetical protein